MPRPPQPEPPTSIPLLFETGDPIPVRATDAVAWSDDYGGWICHYETDDPRVHRDFRRWRAVWSEGAWESAEV